MLWQLIPPAATPIPPSRSLFPCAPVRPAPSPGCRSCVTPYSAAKLPKDVINAVRSHSYKQRDPPDYIEVCRPAWKRSFAPLLRSDRATPANARRYPIKVAGYYPDCRRMQSAPTQVRHYPIPGIHQTKDLLRAQLLFDR